MNAQNTTHQGQLIIADPVQITDEAIYGSVSKMINSDPDIRDAKDYKDFLGAIEPAHRMQALHSDENPIFVDDQHIAFIWFDPEYPDDVDFMVAMIFKIDQNPDGSFLKSPCGVIAGDQFQGVFSYRAPCCGQDDSALSILCFIKDAEEKIGFATRDSEFTKIGMRKLFERTPDGITVNSQRILHILGHHFEPGADCKQDHDKVLPKPVM